MADMTDSARLETLAAQMRMTTSQLDAEPEDRVWTAEEVAALEGVRQQAQRLYDMATATLEGIREWYGTEGVSDE
jgi:hypothetical protein